MRKPVVVAERAEGRDNNFNLLRMIAASAVLVSHAYPLSLGRDAIEPLLTSTGYKLGTTAVTIFFAVSGFFITKSFDRRNSIPDFLLARVARIYPALIVVLMLSAFILGPIFTVLPVGQYFSNLHTWTYVPRDLMLRHQQWALPGVFLSAPGGPAVNGSLWTLFAEVSCYGLVMLFGLLRLTRPLSFPLILCLAVALIVSTLGWTYIFYLNVPIVLALMLGVIFCTPIWVATINSGSSRMARCSGCERSLTQSHCAPRISIAMFSTR